MSGCEINRATSIRILIAFKSSAQPAGGFRIGVFSLQSAVFSLCPSLSLCLCLCLRLHAYKPVSLLAQAITTISVTMTKVTDTDANAFYCKLN